MSSESSIPRQFHLLSFEGPDLHLLPCIGAFDGLARDALRVA